jgi:TPR repeat protein
MYTNGHGVPQDNFLAFNYYLEAAELGFAPAQWKLGCLYENGQGVPQDYSLAFKWFSAAAEDGAAPAQYRLGDLYSNGRGVPVDNAQAYAWFSVAGANGYELGQKSRDEVSINMTPSAIEKGQQLANEIREHLCT